MRTKVLLFLVVFALLTPSFVSAATWEIDPEHSSVGFSVRHMMVTNVKGIFERFSGSAAIDDSDITKSKVSAVIETASINTKITKRDEHLRSADFFDVAKYPTLTFVSKKVLPSGKDKLKVVGDLTIRGIVKEVTLEVEGPTASLKDPWGKTRRGASAVTKVNRRDFGLLWNAALETGGVLVGDEVTISLEIEFIKK